MTSKDAITLQRSFSGRIILLEDQIRLSGCINLADDLRMRIVISFSPSHAI